MNILELEASLFTRYLIGRDISPQASRLYITAVGSSKPNTADKKLLDFMVKHPRSIGLIDAGLVIHNSTSEARRRLYVMLAILEASTENHDLFLPTKRNPFYIFAVGLSGLRAVVKAVLGLLLVKVIA